MERKLYTVQMEYAETGQLSKSIMYRCPALSERSIKMWATDLFDKNQIWNPMLYDEHEYKKYRLVEVQIYDENGNFVARKTAKKDRWSKKYMVLGKEYYMSLKKGS